MKKIKILAIALISALSMNSCLVDEDVDSQNQAESGFAAGFSRGTISHIITPSQTENISESVKVNLIGGNGAVNSSSDIVLNYSIDPSSTAVQGTHYNITNTTNEITIPAGRDFAPEDFMYEVLIGGINAGESFTIIVNLESANNNVFAAAQYAPLTVNITKCDPPLVGNYNVASPGYNDGDASNVASLGCDTYRATYLPLADGFNQVVNFEFKHNADDSLEITSIGFTNSYTLTSGVKLANGTLRFVGFTLIAGDPQIPALENYDFDLVPNP